AEAAAQLRRHPDAAGMDTDQLDVVALALGQQATQVVGHVIEALVNPFAVVGHRDVRWSVSLLVGACLASDCFARPADGVACKASSYSGSGGDAAFAEVCLNNEGGGETVYARVTAAVIPVA